MLKIFSQSLQGICGIIIFVSVFLSGFLSDAAGLHAEVKDGTIVAPSFAWLAFGDLRGYVEPCGCDPKTDKGGINRIYHAVQKERLQTPELMVLNLGNNLEPKVADADKINPNSVNPNKTKAFHDFYALLKPAASLLNRLEIAYLHTGASISKEAAWVLSNLKKTEDRVAAFRLTPSSLILGYVSPEKESTLRTFDAAMLKEWKSLAKQNPREQRILLFSGPKTDLSKIADTGLFSEIILSNQASMDQAADAREIDEPRILYLNVGKSSYRQVPLGGQGLLRGGSLALARAPSVIDLFSGSSASRPVAAAKESSLPTAALFDWLDLSYDRLGDKIKPLVDYLAAQSASFAGMRAAKLAGLANSEFVGSAACAGCHASANEAWTRSAHGRAHATLIAKKADTNPECVAFHVVGFDRSGGFVDLEATPHLKDVGCEQCHGPRKGHIADPTRVKASAKTADARAVCTSCHHPPHSSAFDFKAYWEKIKHGK